MMKSRSAISVFHYALLRHARQLMTEEEVAIAAEYAHRGDTGDAFAAGELWKMAEAIIAESKRRRVVA